MNLRQAKELLAKLKALAEDPAAQPGEREVAAAKYRELSKKIETQNQRRAKRTARRSHSAPPPPNAAQEPKPSYDPSKISPGLWALLQLLQLALEYLKEQEKQKEKHR